jgi:hypothetical protein
MFERFTDKARKVVFLAKGKATERGDDQIDRHETTARSSRISSSPA